jgi:hypothetical protein
MPASYHLISHFNPRVMFGSSFSFRRHYGLFNQSAQSFCEQSRVHESVPQHTPRNIPLAIFAVCIERLCIAQPVDSQVSPRRQIDTVCTARWRGGHQSKFQVWGLTAGLIPPPCHCAAARCKILDHVARMSAGVVECESWIEGSLRHTVEAYTRCGAHVQHMHTYRLTNVSKKSSARCD